MPSITVITPVRNRAPFIRWAMESLAPERAQGLEHIVVDGASTDGTLDILKQVSGITLVSEPDNGLYQALNKGLRMANGDFVGWQNSDDVFLPGAMSSFHRAIQSRPDAEMVSGAAIMCDTMDADAPPKVVVDDAETIGLEPDTLLTGIPIINARLFKRTLLKRIGPFDERFPVASDRDFLIRCRAAGFIHAAVRGRVYRYTIHPESLSIYSHSRSKQNRHNLDAAAVRLGEKHSGELGRLYQRWHAWCVSYQCGALMLEGQPASAARVMLRGTRLNPSWAVHGLAMAGAHWQRARVRRMSSAAESAAPG